MPRTGSVSTSDGSMPTSAPIDIACTSPFDADVHRQNPMNKAANTKMSAAKIAQSR